MPTIYRKTAKGVDEIQTRKHRLTPRVRGVLIMVDGHRSDEELAATLPQAHECMAQLLEQGFIELLAELASGPTPSPAPLPARAPAAAAPPTPTGPVPLGGDAQPASSLPAPQRDFRTVQREAVRRLNELAGPAGEDLAIRMERSKDLNELRPLLVHARNLIAGLRGKQAADGYISALSAL